MKIYNFLIFLILALLSLKVTAAEDLGQKALDLLTNKCGACHGPSSPGLGGFNKVLDFAFLRQSVYVKPGFPEQSVLQQQIDTNKMPLGAPMNAAEKDLVRAWIKGGALDPLGGPSPVARIPSEKWGQAMIDEIQAVNVSDRPFVRFISFTHLFNRSGSQSGETADYYNSITKLLNSLSQEPEVLIPKTVNGLAKSTFAFDIRSLGWTVQQWAQLENQYPYLIKTKEVLKLMELTKSKVPVINGDWFLKVASTEPTYSALLGHPDNSNLLEASLGIDRVAEVNSLKVARAGFIQSGVANHNRVIDRHQMPGTDFRGYWISYDFATGDGAQDIVENPFGPVGASTSPRTFSHDGGEIIYHLPNGFFGYMLVNSKGQRLSQAPIEIVKDQDPRRPVISNGISCFTCHGNGLLQKFDTVSQASFNSGAFSSQEISKLKKIYIGQDNLSKLFSNDNQIYLAALDKAKIPFRKPEDEFINKFVYRFLDVVDSPTAAETLGVPPEKLKGLTSTENSVNLLISQLNSIGVPRSKFDQFFSKLVALVAGGTVVPPLPPPNPLPTENNVSALSLGDGFSCAIVGSKLKCWGETYGTPAPQNLKNISLLSAGRYHACVNADGKLVCWGDNANSQLSFSSSLQNPSLIAAGGYHTCGLFGTKVSCWGSNGSGQLDVPADVVSPTQLASGIRHSCALVGSKIRCWGDNSFGQLDVPSSAAGASAVLAYGSSTCALVGSSLKCWGNSGPRTQVPYDIASLKLPAIGGTHGCGISGTKTVCWGENTHSQLSVPNFSQPEILATGEDHSCAASKDKIFCWGNSGSGATAVPVF